MKSLKVHKASKTSTANKEVSMSNAQPDQASSSKEQQSKKKKRKRFSQPRVLNARPNPPRGASGAVNVASTTPAQQVPWKWNIYIEYSRLFNEN